MSEEKKAVKKEREPDPMVVSTDTVAPDISTLEQQYPALSHYFEANEQCDARGKKMKRR